MTGIEQALRELGRGLAVPPTPELATGVLARIERRDGRTRLAGRRLALALAVTALALLGATLAIPEARSAFLRVLHIGGERIEIVDDLPEVQPTDLESTLGERVTLADAVRRSSFPLRTLDDAPDRVYLGERGTVWFLYGTPDAVRLLVGQTPRSRIDAPVLGKKVAGSGTRVEEVQVEGRRGLFLSGKAHFLFLMDENGDPVEASARLAEDVLLWDAGGIAYRLEGDLALAEALELAAQLD